MASCRHASRCYHRNRKSHVTSADPRSLLSRGCRSRALQPRFASLNCSKGHQARHAISTIYDYRGESMFPHASRISQRRDTNNIDIHASIGIFFKYKNV